MAVPEGWEWLDDVPEEWETPADLREPTRHAEANLAIKLLSCEFLGHEVRVALGNFISEYSLYTMWFLSEIKGPDFGMKETALLSGVPAEQTHIVYEAWKVLDAVEGLDAPNDVVRERRVTAAAALTSALRGAAETLRRVQRENSRNS